MQKITAQMKKMTVIFSKLSLFNVKTTNFSMMGLNAPPMNKYGKLLGTVDAF
jgi:hypothetical protein